MCLNIQSKSNTTNKHIMHTLCLQLANASNFVKKNHHLPKLKNLVAIPEEIYIPVS